MSDKSGDQWAEDPFEATDVYGNKGHYDTMWTVEPKEASSQLPTVRSEQSQLQLTPRSSSASLDSLNCPGDFVNNAERSGFGRQNEGPNINTNQARVGGSPNPSPTVVSPSMPPLAQQSSFSSNMSSVTENGTTSTEIQPAPEPAKLFFFREQYAKLGVKGNFMPLAAQPAHVSLADWLAHQTVENFRLVDQVLSVIQEVNTITGKPICNPETCPRMAAGRHTYTWLDNNKAPISVTAPQYISLVQRWLNGKIHDQKAFPVDPPLQGAGSTFASGSLGTPTGERPIAAGPTNLQAPLSALSGREWFGKKDGFPEAFLHDVRTCFRQIFRIYAHLYHSHWVEPFWDLSGTSNGIGWTDLNSCFVQYCTVAKLYGLLSDKDAEPMQPLIDIWITNGSIPADAARGACAAAVMSF